jgi:hypothetical protein
MKTLLKNRSGTAEIVGTVLFLIILFFFFSNVFLWHNQVTREMDQVVADKTNSPVRIETTVLPGTPVTWPPGTQSLPQGGYIEYPFDTGMTTNEKTVIANLRFSIYASFTGAVNEPCYVQILDYNHVPVNTGLMVMNDYTWSNITLSLPSNYIDAEGDITIRIMDASTQSGGQPGRLDIRYMAVCADPVALKVTDLGGSDATLSRLWIVNATQTADAQTDHVYTELNDTLVAGGSTRTIMFNIETALTADNDSLVVNYVPPAGETVIFKVLTTLGNTAACSIAFPD